MSLLKWMGETFSAQSWASAPQDQPSINSATGLPMVGPLDIAGNVYGTSMHDHAPSTSAHNWPSSSWSSGASDTYASSSSSSWTPPTDYWRPPSGSDW